MKLARHAPPVLAVLLFASTLQAFALADIITGTFQRGLDVAALQPALTALAAAVPAAVDPNVNPA